MASSKVQVVTSALQAIGSHSRRLARRLWRTGENRRYRAHAALIDEWVRAGRLPAGSTARRAHDLLWALTGPDVFRLLVVERHWTQQRRLDTVARLLESALFPQDARLQLE